MKSLEEMSDSELEEAIRVLAKRRRAQNKKELIKAFDAYVEAGRNFTRLGASLGYKAIPTFSKKGRTGLCKFSTIERELHD